MTKEAYMNATCAHNRTEEVWEATVMEYQRLVFESFGVVSHEGERAFAILSQMLPDNAAIPLSRLPAGFVEGFLWIRSAQGTPCLGDSRGVGGGTCR